MARLQASYNLLNYEEAWNGSGGLSGNIDCALIFIGTTIAAAFTGLPAAAADQADALDSITVTAQRRVENQQDVPISISSISGDALTKGRIRSLQDLNAFAPGLTTTSTVSYSAAPISIRGIGSANGGGNFFNDEPVAVYVDGVYVARLSMSTAELLDIDSVQIMRGPQGTLYGRNSTAGAILITSNAPSRAPAGSLRASVSSFSDYRVQGFLTGPLSDTLSARAALGYSSREGYGTNIVSNENIGGGEDFTARLAFRFQPAEALSFDLIGEYQDRSASPTLLAVTDVGGNGVASPFVRRADMQFALHSREFQLNDVNSTQSDTWSITAKSEADLGFATLDAIAGYRDWALVGAQDSDSTALQLFTNSGDIASEQFSYEMRLASKSNGPFLWLIGGHYLHDSTDVMFSIQNYQGLLGLGTNAVFGASQDTDAMAIFADATYDVVKNLSVTVGGRYSREEKIFENALLVTILNGGTLPPSVLNGATLSAGAIFSSPPIFSDDASFDDFSLRAIIDYKPIDQVLIYASYSQGFKSGGFNSFGLNPAFNAENVDAYEVGVKTELFQNRMLLNASGFIYDYSDLQIRLPVPTGGVDIQNVAAANIKGFELEGTAILFDGLTLSTGLAFLDTEIIDGLIPAISTQTPPFPIGAPLALALEDVSGNRLTRAPAFQSHVSATYVTAIGSLTGSFNASFRYQGSVFFLETNQDADTFMNSAWGEFDLRVSLANASDHWEIAFFAKNVTDQRHITAVTALGGFPNAAVNEPRRWGASLTLRL